MLPLLCSSLPSQCQIELQTITVSQALFAVCEIYTDSVPPALKSTVSDDRHCIFYK